MDAALTLLLFLAASAALVVGWNRFFAPVPPRWAALLFALIFVYQAPTLLTKNVDLPGGIAFHSHPWKATGKAGAHTNTGIVFTQIAPWAATARRALHAGELPWLNRYSAAGAPLLPNQQSTALHPFTLLGLPLSLGKSFTLSASLRLFVVAFFTFVLLREYRLSERAAWFGAAAYTFSTFHILWLLFPLGLASMMLPLTLTGAHLYAKSGSRRAQLLLLAGLALSILGGHPESALYVWIAAAGYVAIASANAARIALGACTFLMAMGLTAFSWYPTLVALRETTRYRALQSKAANPADHGLSHEWLLPLIAPNILGTPMAQTYRPPRGHHAAVLNDYGEVASGYAGIVTLGLAVAALSVRRRTVLALAAIGVVALLTMAEAPYWRDLVRAVPLLGISIHQRLRVFWCLAMAGLAAVMIDSIASGGRRRWALAALVAASTSFVMLYAMRRPQALLTAEVLIPMAGAAAVVAAVALRTRYLVPIAAVAVLVDLVTATRGYNPPSAPRDVYPELPAITMLRPPAPARIAALGWSLLPDTPGVYALEDIKTTDPIAHTRYLQLVRSFLQIDPLNYDLGIGKTNTPFFDYLNVRRVYVPPGETVDDPSLSLIYTGPDGAVYENLDVLPRYFLVRRVYLEPSFHASTWRLPAINNFADLALVNEVPEEARQAFGASAEPIAAGGGELTLVRYGRSSAILDVQSNGWNLLVTSDVHWPGWRAFHNGRELPVVTVNGAFVGCFVPPGSGRVELRYRPAGLEAGGWAAAAALILGVAVFARRRA